MPAMNVTLTAQWTINTYTITFNSNRGSVVQSITQDYDTVILPVENPTRVGYSFNRWNQTIPSRMPAENITLIAEWTINTYTITFDSNGGSAVQSITQAYDTEINLPANPTRLGHIFNGWNQVVPAYMPAGNLTITANWTIDIYTITFDTNGGSAIQSISQAYGSSITPPADPTRQGYIFNGWSHSIPNHMPAEHLTFQAFWILNSKDTGDVITRSDDLHSRVDTSLTQGKDVEITIKIEIQPKENVMVEEFNVISDLIKNTLQMRRSGSLFINIEIILKEAGYDDLLIEELAEPISITISIPKEHQGYRHYHIIRIHQGNAEVLETVYDQENQTLTFETNRFSTYVIAYETSTGFNYWWLLLLLIIPALYLIYSIDSKKRRALVVED